MAAPCRDTKELLSPDGLADALMLMLFQHTASLVSTFFFSSDTRV
jgi:hypothetical protein